MTLEGYLCACADQGIIDHEMRLEVTTEHKLHIIVHPASKDGPTMILDVLENRLKTVWSSDDGEAQP